MTEEEKKEQKDCETLQEQWMAQMKRIMLAGMGAVAMAQDEMEAFVKKMVERGQIAEKEGRKWMKEFMEKGRKQTKDTMHSIEDTSMESFEKILNKFNIPTKHDFETLSQRVEKLGERVEELSKKLGQ